MPLQIVRNDLTSMTVDAIVNPTNPSFSAKGGTDRAVHQAAGADLDIACSKLDSCPPGEVRLTRGYDLPARYIIHTVGPIWKGGNHHEQEILISCYRQALALARKHHFRSIAFPLISSGVYGYPKDLALKTAVDTIGEFLLHHEMQVYLVVFDRNAYRISSKLFSDIAAYIDDHYVQEHEDESDRPAQRQRRLESVSMAMALPPVQEGVKQEDWNFQPEPESGAFLKKSLEDVLAHMDESFSDMLLRKIDERGMSDAECYKKANIDRKLFSKIRSNPSYHPSKATVLAFALALELPLEEMTLMLQRAGFALSRSSKFDLIVGFFVEKGIYNVFEINESLFAFGQNLIGQN